MVEEGHLQKSRNKSTRWFPQHVMFLGRVWIKDWWSDLPRTKGKVKRILK